MTDEGVTSHQSLWPTMYGFSPHTALTLNTPPAASASMTSGEIASTTFSGVGFSVLWQERVNDIVANSNNILLIINYLYKLSGNSSRPATSSQAQLAFHQAMSAC